MLRHRFFVLAVALSTILGLCLVPTVRAAVLTVPGDYSTIQECIAAAVSGVDECLVSPGTYNEIIDFSGKAIMLRSSDGPVVTIIDATGLNDSVVKCVTGEGPDTILDGFTITGGNATFGGGMHNDGSSPMVTNCIFSDNTTIGPSGGFGGGMYNLTSNPTVVNCTFSGNWGFSGGGMYNLTSNPTVANCTFSANVVNIVHPSSTGGGMYNRDSNPTVTNCTFSGNQAGGGGGAMLNHGGNPIINNCTFTGCFTAQRGGGMFNFQTSPRVSNCSFSGNSASIIGGGMYNFVNASPTVTNCAFTNNGGGGGGVGGPPWGGGGMANFDSSNPTVTNCMFNGNSIFGRGGGMYNSGSSPTVTNCAFSGNSANWEHGGGMYNEAGSSPTITNCAFNGNTAAEFGGGMWNGNSSPTVTNGILWGNSDSSGTGESAQIHTDSGTPEVNYSILQGGWGGLGGTGNSASDPLFVDPDGADHIPGTLDDDLRVSEGSPAIDAGNNAAVPPDTADLDGDGDAAEPTPFDLDRNTRFIDDPDTGDCPQPGADCGTPPIVDMGAYEYQGGGEPIPTVSEWGMAVMSLLVLTAGTLVLARSDVASRELWS